MHYGTIMIVHRDNNIIVHNNDTDYSSRYERLKLHVAFFEKLP